MPDKPNKPGDLLAEQAKDLAVTAPDKPNKPGDLLAEQAKNLAVTAAAGAGPVGMALAGITAAAEVMQSAGSESSVQQYLIASGGNSGGDKALANATLAAFNKMASLRSRM